MSKRIIAAGLAIFAVAANLLLQNMLLAPGVKSRVLVPGLADFLPAWNRGVSFSLLVQNGDTGRELLIAVLAVIIAVVAGLAWRATHYLAAAGLGLVLGGALDNLIDRLRYDGAVFDFLSLHLGRMPLFICNLADIFISLGVALLLLDALRTQPARIES